FFQAEDGIRDKLVTGVQTCALPISQILGRLVEPLGKLNNSGKLENAPMTLAGAVRKSRLNRRFQIEFTTWRVQKCHTGAPVFLRSEERRVGKECGSRWGAKA